MSSAFYTARKLELVEEFIFEAQSWSPFLCYLDFPKSTMGLLRTMTLAEGKPKCDYRFKEEREIELGWPLPFTKRDGD